jgi:signal transduction histidine kinase
VLETGPDWASITTAVATAATALILLATAVFVGRQLRDARRTRHAQLATELSRRWDDAAFVESQSLSVRYSAEELVELMNKVYETKSATDEERDELRKLESIPNFWETIGVLQAEGALSLSMVERMWGEALLADWAAWESAVKRLRAVRNIPTVYLYFERTAIAVLALQREQRLLRRLVARVGTRKRRPGRSLKARVHARILLHRRKKH